MATSKRRIAALLFSSGLIVLTAACGAGSGTGSPPPPAPTAGSDRAASLGGPSAAPSAAPSLERAKLAFTAISAVQSPFWIAYEAGYFREQGLDVPDMNRIEPGATMLAALHNGELEFIAAGAPSLVLGTLQGLDTLVFGASVNWLEDVIVARPEIQSVQDLRGQTIGVSRLKAITDLSARFGVERFGLKPDVDVFIRGTGGNTESLAALEAGTVAAASLSVPAVFEANKRGYHDLIDVTAMRIPFGNGNYGATKATLDRRPQVAERVLRAVAQATSRFKTDPEYAAQIIGKYSQIQDAEALRGTVAVYTPLFVVDPYPDAAAIQAVLDAEENPAARTARPEQVIDYRAADAVRQSGFLDRLPRDEAS
jgi:ABC-type nitrate/sulfonate/bicarbonate transport system substrate-binding protein